MHTLYPAIKTYAKHKLAVEKPHTLYIEECGNPDGLPILVVHSGPGTGCEPYHRRFFDPERYRIVLFDQRGAGRSTPHAELDNNTTTDLLADMEQIREYLKIDRWILFGGAWGSTLSMLYAEAHPERVMGLILHNIFLARKRDIDWFYRQGANLMFPDYWADFMKNLSAAERKYPLKSYHARLIGNDEVTRMATAKAWSLWQARCAALQPHSNIIHHFCDPHFAVGLACIESHYFVNDCFMKDNHILTNINKIKHIPAYIIHGRYDMVCPLECAWELHQHWPSSELYIIRDAGHSDKEPGIIDALILASKKFISPSHLA